MADPAISVTNIESDREAPNEHRTPLVVHPGYVAPAGWPPRARRPCWLLTRGGRELIIGRVKMNR